MTAGRGRPLPARCRGECQGVARFLMGFCGSCTISYVMPAYEASMPQVKNNIMKPRCREDPAVAGPVRFLQSKDVQVSRGPASSSIPWLLRCADT